MLSLTTARPRFPVGHAEAPAVRHRRRPFPVVRRVQVNGHVLMSFRGASLLGGPGGDSTIPSDSEVSDSGAPVPGSADTAVKVRGDSP